MDIEARDVRKTYGTVTALEGLSLSIPSGSTVGLLGTNGAGKTTLLRLLIGHERPDAGSVGIGDTDVATAGPAIRDRVGYLPERAGFPPELTGREVLRTQARVRRTPNASARIEDVLETVGLAEDADRPVEGYSNGMQRRLGLAAALLPDPAVLLLDEPAAGLDPLGVATLRQVVADVRERTDATVVISSHTLSLMERLCDRVAILDSGRLLASGPVSQLLETHGRHRTVVVRTDCAPPDRLVDRCRDFGEVALERDRLVLTVPSADLVDALDALDERVDLDVVSVRDRDLGDAFEAVVAGEQGGETARASGPPDGDAVDDRVVAPEEGSP